MIMKQASKPAGSTCFPDYARPEDQYRRPPTLAELEARVGGLSRPSKMPGYAYGIPARACTIGALLAKIKGSTCASCYALKGRYAFANVQAAQERRLAILVGNLPQWTIDMINVLQARYKGARKSDRFFRWHDSGDVQSVEHVLAIFEVCRATPNIRHWMPTRESARIREALAREQCPENLTIRFSAAMVGSAPAPMPEPVRYSTVDAPGGSQCPAPRQGNSCRECRACWGRDVHTVNYVKH
jgi:hypothetical protein